MDNSTSTTLLALQKAYDTIWKNVLSFKMYKFGFPIHIITMVKSYLDSNSKTLAEGLIQGGLLFLILFNINFNEIPKSQRTELAHFTDDTAGLVVPRREQW